MSVAVEMLRLRPGPYFRGAGADVQVSRHAADVADVLEVSHADLFGLYCAWRLGEAVVAEFGPGLAMHLDPSLLHTWQTNRAAERRHAEEVQQTLQAEAFLVDGGGALLVDGGGALLVDDGRGLPSVPE